MTGGAGFIGSHVVDRLVERKHDVVVLDNLDPQVHGVGAQEPANIVEHLASGRVECIQGDVRDPVAVEQALAGVDAVVHLAAAVGVYEPHYYTSVNVDGLEPQRRLEQAGLPVVSVIHPAATVSTHATVGTGSVILAGAVVNAFACLGRGCIVNTCASVDHDCVLGDGVHVSPGAHLGGGVTVGPASWVGIGASVKHGVHLGARVVVGAGAAVVRDVPDGTTVVGVPARPLHS